MSKYMTKLKTQLTSRTTSPVGESSANKYIGLLRTINGKKDFSSLTFLKDTVSVKKFIDDNYPNRETRKGFYGAILSTLREASKNKAYNDATRIYVESFELNRPPKDEDIHAMNDKQKENSMEWSEFLAKQSELSQEASKITKLRFDKNKSDRLTIIENLLLSLYTLVAPRRSLDYFEMKLDIAGGNEDENHNYYTPSTKTFVFNVYKTRGSYGKQTVVIPQKLYEILDNYIILNNIKNGDNILKTAMQKSFSQPGVITTLLNGIFGKKISVNELRHSYANFTFGDVFEDLEKHASDLSHSVSMHVNYVKVVK